MRKCLLSFSIIITLTLGKVQRSDAFEIQSEICTVRIASINWFGLRAKWKHSVRNIATRTDVKSEVGDTRDRFNYGPRFLRELSVHSVSRGNESCGAARPDAHVCVGVIDRAHGAFGIFTAAITPTVFHSAYLWLSLINDTVVLTPLKYRGDRGISRPRGDINNCTRIALHACTDAQRLRNSARKQT